MLRRVHVTLGVRTSWTHDWRGMAAAFTELMEGHWCQTDEPSAGYWLIPPGLIQGLHFVAFFRTVALSPYAEGGASSSEKKRKN